ncbi:MAG: TetR/AcrR family transcriptional regulator [Nitrospirae bacterium]|nr:TetR/AcrR family transcriptional regulator [Nitrospirota bacterium]
MSKDTREKILDAGLRLFSKKGYLGSTTKEIAKAAGVAELTLFRHFASKEKLFEEMISRHSFLPALKVLLPGLKDMSYEDALFEIAKRFLERLSERRELIRIMHSEIYLYPAKVKEIYHTFIDEILRTLASYFRDLQGRNILRDFNPEAGARAFLGMFFSFFNSQEFLMRKEVRNIDTEKVIRDFIDIFIRGTMK